MMEEKLSPLAKGILGGLEETLQDAQGIPVDGMRKTMVYVEPDEQALSVRPVDSQSYENRYIRKPNVAVL